jgi:hypothetical protein
MKLHETVMRSFANTVQPRDTVEWIFVRDAADIQLEIQRYRLLKTGIISQARQDMIECVLLSVKTELAKNVAEVRTTEEAQLDIAIKKLTGDPERIKTDAERLKKEFQERVNAKIADLEAAAARTGEDETQMIEDGIYDGALVGGWIAAVERVDHLCAAAEDRWERLLRSLDAYRHGLGERFRKAAAGVIEGEYEEVNVAATPLMDSPPVAPSTSSAPVE